MSVHPSFKSGKGKQQKSVLKRLARLLLLQKEEKWEEDKNSIFGLPKAKVLKLKFKKDKKEAPEEADAVAAANPDVSLAPEKSKEALKPGAKDKAKK